MNIGIDIDDTIADTYNIQFVLAQRYTINQLKREAKILKKIEKVSEYQYYCKKYHNWTDEENKAFWNQNYKTIMENVKPKFYAKEIIEKLKNDGNNIFIITARFSIEGVDSKIITEQWLNKNNIEYTKLIVNAEDKRKVATENNIDVFIDDDIENCIDVSKENIKTYLMDSYHNQNIETEGIERVFSWPHIYQKIINS